jgi:hypothetical protein
MRRFLFYSFLFAGALLPVLLFAQVPQLISYQGRIMVSSTNFNGNGLFKFALVNTSASVSFWSNDGTSIGGNEPTATVSLNVTNGLYALLLGDTNLANMTAIPLTVFTNSDVRLRIWFNDGVSGSQRLAPDQRLAAVGYAMMGASVVDGAITSNKLANGAVSASKLADGSITSNKIADGSVTSAKIASNAVTSAQLADSVALGSSSVNGQLDIYRTTAGTAAISLDGSLSTIATYGNDGQVKSMLSGNNYGRLQLYNSSTGNGLAVNLSANGTAGGWLNLYSSNTEYRAILNGANDGGYMTLYNSRDLIGVYLESDDANHAGHLSLRTASGLETFSLRAQESAGSGSKLEMFRTNGLTRSVLIDGDVTSGGEGSGIWLYSEKGQQTIEILASESAGTGGQIEFYRTNGTRTVQIDGDSGTQGGYLALYNEFGNKTIDMDADLTDSSGEIGMYSSNGVQLVSLVASENSGSGGQLAFYRTNGALTVEIDGDVLAGGAGGGVWLYSQKGQKTVEILAQESANAGGQIELYRTNGTRTVQIDGEVGTGGGGYMAVYSSNGTALIELDSNVSGDGRIKTPVLEITGGSDLSEQFNVKAPIGTTEPGMIVCVDPENPGSLVVSSRAYDSTVAGILSGAGGVKPGMLMGQSRSLANGTYPVALSGRVYCLVDANQNSIRPGDLITTSSTPGYGMKAADRFRAQGSVIGKAITGLEKGRGLILVLVTLQ